jgi:hypothetical protein
VQFLAGGAEATDLAWLAARGHCGSRGKDDLGRAGKCSTWNILPGTKRIGGPTDSILRAAGIGKCSTWNISHKAPEPVEPQTGHRNQQTAPGLKPRRTTGRWPSDPLPGKRQKCSTWNISRPSIATPETSSLQGWRERRALLSATLSCCNTYHRLIAFRRSACPPGISLPRSRRPLPPLCPVTTPVHRRPASNKCVTTHISQRAFPPQASPHPSPRTPKYCPFLGRCPPYPARPLSCVAAP